MKTKHLLVILIKYCGIILAALFGVYLLFPVWASWLVSANLPANIKLLEFESHYPGFTDISIQRLVVIQSERKYSLEGLQIDYNLNDISLNQLTVELIAQSSGSQISGDQTKPIQLSDFKLAELSVQDFAPLERLQRVTIAQTSVLNDSQKFQFSQLELINRKPGRYEFKISMQYPSRGKIADLTGLLGIDVEEEKMSLQVASKQVTNKELPLFQAYHQQVANQRKVDLRIHSTNLLRLFSTDWSKLAVTPKGDINIHWLQDDLADSRIIQVKSLWSVLPEQINLSDISIMAGGDIPSQNRIEIPLELSLHSKLGQLDSADIKISGTVNKGLKIQGSDMQVDLGPSKFNISTTLSSLKLNSKIQRIMFEKSHIDWSGVDLKINRQLSNIGISEYQLKGITDIIEVNINDLENTQWQFKGVFTSPEVLGSFIKSESSGQGSKPLLVNSQVDTNQSENYQNEGSQNDTNQNENSQTLQLDSRVKIDFEIAKTEDMVTSGELLLSRLKIIDPNYQLNGPLEFNWQSVHTDLSQGSASLVFSSDDNQLMGFDYDNLKAEVDLSLERYQIKGEGKLSINQQSLAPFAFQFDKPSSLLSVDLKKNQLAIQVFNHFLAAIGEQNKMALEILAGEMVHSAGVGFDELFLMDSHFAIKDMLFKFGENQIHGLNVTQKLTSFEPLKLQAQIAIEKIVFNSGLTIDNLSASLSSRSMEDVSLTKVRAELLEGQLIADNLQIGSDPLKIYPLQLQQISLTELLFMIDVAGLYGEGKLDFFLPLKLESGTVTVNEGSFKATGQGLIKYTSGQSKSGAEENIALQALKNFHYTGLDGTLSYNKAGEYHIKLHLLGSNPELYDGYPIDFVLNLRGALSGVFRSLFLTGSFEEAVMQQVKTEQNQDNR